MRYLLLIHLDEADLATWSPQKYDQALAGCAVTIDEMKKADAYIASARLQPTRTATTVRVRAGQTLMTDGPFAETKEQLGGFYLIRANDLDEALAWAARLPQAVFSSIEVRPLWE